MTTRKELLPGVFLTSIQDGRFKTACFSLSFLRPLRAGEAAMNALLPSVLLRGRESAPSILPERPEEAEAEAGGLEAASLHGGQVDVRQKFESCCHLISSPPPRAAG